MTFGIESRLEPPLLDDSRSLSGNDGKLAQNGSVNVGRPAVPDSEEDIVTRLVFFNEPVLDAFDELRDDGDAPTL